MQVPESLEWEGKAVNFTDKNYSWTGKLTLKTSNDPLRGKLDVLNTIDFIGEVGVIGSYRIHELGQSRFSGQNDFIYGECECPILEDPEMDSVKNDREKLISNERSDALIAWVREQVEALAEKMELKNTRETASRARHRLHRYGAFSQSRFGTLHALSRQSLNHGARSRSPAIVR